MSTPTPQRARQGISLFFFTNGAIFAGLLPRFPEVKELLQISNTEFGLIVIANSIGAMAALSLPALAIRKFGARAASLWGTVALVIAMGLAGCAATMGSAPLFMALIFLSGLTDAVVDMAQNTHALRVQDAYGRSIINSLHAFWSAGCIVGGLAGSWAAMAHVPLSIHMPVASAALLAVAAFAVKLSEIPADATATRQESRHGVGSARGRLLTLLPLAVIGIAGIQVETVGNDWSANFMVGAIGWSIGDAGAIYVVMVIAQFIGRITGDFMVDRWGRVPVARAGLVLSSAGFLLASLVPHAWMAFPAFALAGFGCATIVPAVFAAADVAPGFAEGSALTFVAWVMRLSGLVTSPLIGFVADSASLRWAILVPLILGIASQFIMNRVNHTDPAVAVAKALESEEGESASASASETNATTSETNATTSGQAANETQERAEDSRKEADDASE